MSSHEPFVHEPDQDLLDRRALDLADRDDVIREPGQRDEGLDRREIDLDACRRSAAPASAASGRHVASRPRRAR